VAVAAATVAVLVSPWSPIVLPLAALAAAMALDPRELRGALRRRRSAREQASLA
jgi:hypothetical protein